MQRSIAQKAQIMAIMDGIAGYAEYGKLVFIVNNFWGYYFKTKDLMLDTEKLVKITEKSKPTKEALDPETMKKNTSLAVETGETIEKYSDKKLIKLESKDNRKAWVNAEYLKQFGQNRKYYVQDEKSPVFITDQKNKPIGMLLPVKVSEEQEQGNGKQNNI